MQTTIDRSSVLLERITAGLTPEQIAVVQHGAGPAVVAAGAGSGKTKVICARIARLVMLDGVHPERILAVTFSKAGAEEMTQRVRALGCNAEVRTFHSLAFKIAREELWGEIDVGDNRYDACVKQAIDEYEKQKGIRIDHTVASAFIDRAKSRLVIPVPEDAAQAEVIARAVHEEIMGEAPFATEVAGLLAVYVGAEALRNNRRIVTFADMICSSVRLLRDDERARQRWASRYDYVIQDECQDQDFAQLMFAGLLAQHHTNYMIVGDPAQSIYRFRGAMPEFMLDFERTWNAQRYTLSSNFRSGASIIQAANTICSWMPDGTHLGIAMAPTRDVAGSITIDRDSTTDHEARRIARELAAALGNGHRPDDYAILLRMGSLSGAFEDALLLGGIPYHLAVGVSFYGRKEVGILLAYLRLIEGVYTSEDVALALKHPTRYLSASFVDTVIAQDERLPWRERVYAAIKADPPRGRGSLRNAEEWAALIGRFAKRHAATPLAPATVLSEIVEQTNYLKWLRRDTGTATADDSRADNVARLIQRAGRFTTLVEFLAFVDEALRQPTTNGKVEGKVVITTIHRAKGLEWPVVYLPSFAEGIIPHSRAPREEEQRLAYVAVTRARDLLRVSCPQSVRISEEVLIPCELSSFAEAFGDVRS